MYVCMYREYSLICHYLFSKLWLIKKNSLYYAYVHMFLCFLLDEVNICMQLTSVLTVQTLK